MRDSDDALANVGSGHAQTDIPGNLDHANGTFGQEREPPSLLDDVFALFEDGKTYLQAEASFQKSRAAFVSNRLKKAVAYGAAAFGVLHLALIAIAVGLVIALAPLVGPWFATLIVGAALILSGVLLLRALKSKIDDIRSAFDRDES